MKSRENNNATEAIKGIATDRNDIPMHLLDMGLTTIPNHLVWMPCSSVNAHKLSMLLR